MTAQAVLPVSQSVSQRVALPVSLPASPMARPAQASAITLHARASGDFDAKLAATRALLEKAAIDYAADRKSVV